MTLKCMKAKISKMCKIYQSIRQEFIDEIKNVAIIEESLIAKQDTNLLSVSLKMAIALKGKE